MKNTATDKWIGWQEVVASLLIGVIGGAIVGIVNSSIPHALWFGGVMFAGLITGCIAIQFAIRKVKRLKDQPQDKDSP